MFTGIVEATGIITSIAEEGTNKHFTIQARFVEELKIDQSIAHNGICLTVVAIENSLYKVTAIAETLTRTNLNDAKAGDLVNLERCMPAHGRFDGHIVQGHVDETALCTQISEKNGSWHFTFQLKTSSNQQLIVEKGSICINGISLTVADVNADQFTVAIIPYTFEHTNLNKLQVGQHVNIEYDILGKYIAKMLASRV